jgi:hypothetical protein
MKHPSTIRVKRRQKEVLINQLVNNCKETNHSVYMILMRKSKGYLETLVVQKAINKK